MRMKGVEPVSKNPISWYFSIPANVPERNHRSYRIWLYVYPLGFAVHVLLIFSFLSMGAEEMALFNIGSSVIWFFVILLNRFGYIYISASFGLAEILAHAAAGVLLLGWHLGFQYAVLLVPCGVFLAPSGHRTFKLSFTLLSFALFIFLHIYSASVQQYAVDSFIAHITGVANITIVFGIIAFMLFHFNRIVERTEQALKIEHRKSESLLHNILPVAIADRLKTDNRTIADGFDETTILFADIVGFTMLSETIVPRDLVELLNRVFSRFDDLTEKYSLEKIKTIGDAYMVAAGIPVPREDHAEVIAELALDMTASLNDIKKETGRSFQMRMGINSGPVVAGVIGKMKFIYDLWGDSVNTAARMESHGIPGEIQVTESTFDLLQDKYVFVERGEVEVKGKGRLRAYLLKGRKSVSPGA